MNLKTILFCIALITGIVLSGYFGPWWAPMAYTVIVSALWNLNMRTAVLASGICMGVVFLVLCIWSVTQDEAGIVVKTGQLLGGMSSYALIFATTLVGVINGILSGWLGQALSGLFRRT